MQRPKPEEELEELPPEEELEPVSVEELEPPLEELEPVEPEPDPLLEPPPDPVPPEELPELVLDVSAIPEELLEPEPVPPELLDEPVPPEVEESGVPPELELPPELADGTLASVARELAALLKVWFTEPPRLCSPMINAIATAEASNAYSTWVAAPSCLWKKRIFIGPAAWKCRSKSYVRHG